MSERKSDCCGAEITEGGACLYCSACHKMLELITRKELREYGSCHRKAYVPVEPRESIQPLPKRSEGCDIGPEVLADYLQKEHPGRWPVNVDWDDKDARIVAHVPFGLKLAEVERMALKSVRDYILQLEARAKNWQKFADDWKRKAEAAEKERDELREAEKEHVRGFNELLDQRKDLKEQIKLLRLRMEHAVDSFAKVSVERDDLASHVRTLEELQGDDEKIIADLRKEHNRLLEAACKVEKERDELRDWLTSWKESHALAVKENAELRERLNKRIGVEEYYAMKYRAEEAERRVKELEDWKRAYQQQQSENLESYMDKGPWHYCGKKEDE